MKSEISLITSDIYIFNIGVNYIRSFGVRFHSRKKFKEYNGAMNEEERNSRGGVSERDESIRGYPKKEADGPSALA